ncbi:MAG: LamG domain-containing protein [Saprospiraceae bacterium]
MKSNFLQFLLAFAIVGSLVFGFTSCDKDDDLPAIDGYNNADEVAASNLLAHWAFEGDGKENKSSTAPSSSVGATFSTGAKGKAVDFNAGYLAYPAIASLSTSLTSFTVSAWVKVANNGSHPSSFFTLARANEWAGNLNFMAETGWGPATSDSVTVKGLIVSNNDFGWQDSRNTIKANAAELADGQVPFPNKIGGQWAQVMITFDATTRLFKVYSNGVKISNPVWEARGSATSPQIAFTTPTKPVIGAWGTNVPGGGTAEAWQVPMTGSMDELRVFNKALTDAEIGALYKLEKAGR